VQCHARAAIREDRPDLVGCEHVRQQCDHDAGVRATHDCDRRFQAVPTVHGDDVPRLEPARLQGAAETRRLVMEILEGQLPAAIDERRAAAVSRNHAFERAPQVLAAPVPRLVVPSPDRFGKRELHRLRRRGAAPCAFRIVAVPIDPRSRVAHEFAPARPGRDGQPSD